MTDLEQNIEDAKTVKQWHFPAIALDDMIIHKNDRICQFRIVEKQPPIEFETVEKLGNVDWGGLGNTGKS